LAVTSAAPCSVLPASATVAVTAATGAFAAAGAADVTVDVTALTALTAEPDALVSTWVVPCSALPAPVTVAATAATVAWPV
jgi:hypothetical protein